MLGSNGSCFQKLLLLLVEAFVLILLNSVQLLKCWCGSSTAIPLFRGLPYQPVLLMWAVGSRGPLPQ